MNVQTIEKTSVNKFELLQKVKEMYRKVALFPNDNYHFETGRKLAEHLGYPAELLDRIPSEAIASFAGVGYFFDLVKLEEGEFVVDLGSGSGMDAFFAYQQVGPTGEVIGIDMTPEQLEKANSLKKSPKENVFFLESQIEELPIIRNCIDAVISNGVINLSSNKQKVFEEAARILRPGGRLVISDIVTEIHLPEHISCNATYWAACIGGAMQIDDLHAVIEDAGFMILEEQDNPYAFLSNGAKGATSKYGIKSISLKAIKL